MQETIDPRLTHRIIVDAGQWTKGTTEAEARKLFKEMHSARKLKGEQVWAVTANTYINDHGSFSTPRSEYCEAVRLK